jgi:hypothetical protein
MLAKYWFRNCERAMVMLYVCSGAFCITGATQERVMYNHQISSNSLLRSVSVCRRKRRQKRNSNLPNNNLRIKTTGILVNGAKTIETPLQCYQMIWNKRLLAEPWWRTFLTDAVTLNSQSTTRKEPRCFIQELQQEPAEKNMESELVRTITLIYWANVSTLDRISSQKGLDDVTGTVTTIVGRDQ